MNSINCLRQTFGRKSLEILAKRLKPSVRAYCSPPQTEVYQAAVLNKFKNHLLLEKLARPNLADGEIRIGVSVCGVSKADVQCIDGHENVSLPFVPGSEFAGEILEVGTNCKANLKPGDKVAVLRAEKYYGGGFATECVVNETECLRLDDKSTLSLTDAVTLIGSYGNAYLAFSKYCHLKPKDAIIVIAGPSGDGLAAIEIASKIFQATVHIVFDSKEIDALVNKASDFHAFNIHSGLTKVYKSLHEILGNRKVKAVYDAVDSSLLYVVSDFVDPTGNFMTNDALYTPETLVKPYFKKSIVQKKTGRKKDESKSTDDEEWTSNIQRINLAKYQKSDPILYKNILNETFHLFTEKKINPYISKTHNSLVDFNKAVKFVNNKKCLGQVLVEISK